MLDDIITKRRKGLSFRQIAKELNTSPGKVQYRWNKWKDSQQNNAENVGKNTNLSKKKIIRDRSFLS